MSSFSYKGILSILVSVFLVSGIMYASSTIISVQTQSIAQGDVIANGWFQEVNDSIVSIRNTLTSNTGNLWWKSWNDIYYTGGNVGIGTGSPNSPLYVSWWNFNTGSVDIVLENRAAWWHTWALESIAQYPWFISWSLAIWDRTTSINHFVIAWNGNVGIGINTPTSKLDVNGDTTVRWKLFGAVKDSATWNGLRVCSGVSDAIWQQYGNGNPCGIYKDIDTGSCGFVATPIYFTSLKWNSDNWMTTWPTAIYFSTPSSFRIYLNRAWCWYTDGVTLVNYALTYDWKIQWMAVWQ